MIVGEPTWTELGFEYFENVHVSVSEVREVALGEEWMTRLSNEEFRTSEWFTSEPDSQTIHLHEKRRDETEGQ